jgi:hypothetical protein
MQQAVDEVIEKFNAARVFTKNEIILRSAAFVPFASDDTALDMIMEHIPRGYSLTDIKIVTSCSDCNKLGLAPLSDPCVGLCDTTLSHIKESAGHSIMCVGCDCEQQAVINAVKYPGAHIKVTIITFNYD